MVSGLSFPQWWFNHGVREDGCPPTFSLVPAVPPCGLVLVSCLEPSSLKPVAANLKPKELDPLTSRGVAEELRLLAEDWCWVRV